MILEIGYDVKVRVRRLSIHFDVHGFVTTATMEQRECLRSYTHAYEGESGSAHMTASRSGEEMSYR